MKTDELFFPSSYEYIRDRVSGEYKMPSLAQLIIEKAGSSSDAELSDP